MPVNDDIEQARQCYAAFFEQGPRRGLHVGRQRRLSARFQANKAQLFDSYPNIMRSPERLMSWTSFKRVLAEAEPCFWMFPATD